MAQAAVDIDTQADIEAVTLQEEGRVENPCSM